jgi:uncharacterized protein (TIGR03382 family)
LTRTQGLDYRCADNYQDGAAVFLDEAGGPGVPWLRFEDVLGPLVCPAGSDVARVCQPLWASIALQTGMGGAASDPTPSDDESNAGCDCGGAESASPLFLLTAWWRSRVRRVPGPAHRPKSR